MSHDPQPTAVRRPASGPPLSEQARVFGRIGLLSFGGPAAQIALMHRVLVEERRWLPEADYLRALSLCMILPGPEAMQLATYGGWRVGGARGAVLAGALFVLPGAVLVLALALSYGAVAAHPQVQAALLGVKAATVAIVVEAILRLSRRALTDGVAVALALAAFVALFALGLPFPLVIALAALVGWLRAAPGAAPGPVAPTASRAVPTLALGMLVWLAPLGLVALVAPPVLAEIGAFFAKLAVLTFGGAYAVLAWMAQDVVEARGWLTAPQLIDALGLAETTPGPLILVTAFVAVLAAGGGPLGLAAGVLTLWVTFVPSVVLILALAPQVDRLAHRPRLQGALSGVTAAVVGVIGSLSLWFALHVAFARVGDGPLALPRPNLSSLDPLALALMALSAWLLLRRGWGVVATLGVAAGVAVAARVALG